MKEKREQEKRAENIDTYIRLNLHAIKVLILTQKFSAETLLAR